MVEKLPNPKNATEGTRKFFVRAENGQKQLIHEEAVELETLRPVEFTFHAGAADVYTVTVTDNLKAPITTRPIEIRESNVEMQNTARDMESLRQWAAVSDGLAVKVEDCPDAGDLVGQIKAKIEQVRRGKEVRTPVGVNGWMLAGLLACLAGEWALRKRWGLV
jgi:hypothetical protein